MVAIVSEHLGLSSPLCRRLVVANSSQTTNPRDHLEKQKTPLFSALLQRGTALVGLPARRPTATNEARPGRRHHHPHHTPGSWTSPRRSLHLVRPSASLFHSFIFLSPAEGSCALEQDRSIHTRTSLSRRNHEKFTSQSSTRLPRPLRLACFVCPPSSATSSLARPTPAYCTFRACLDWPPSALLQAAHLFTTYKNGDSVLNSSCRRCRRRPQAVSALFLASRLVLHIANPTDSKAPKPTSSARSGTSRFALDTRTRHTRKSTSRARTGCATCKSYLCGCLSTN